MTGNEDERIRTLRGEEEEKRKPGTREVHFCVEDRSRGLAADRDGKSRLPLTGRTGECQQDSRPRKPWDLGTVGGRREKELETWGLG